MNPSKSAAHFTGLLLFFIGLAFALNTGGALAYYAQHFYLPSSEFADPFGRQDSQAMPVAIKGSGEWARPRMLLVRAEDDGTEGREVEPVEGEGQKVEGPSPAGTPTKAPVIPRRTLRHFLNEFGSDQLGRQYKRMRPCFYSPIQCLMKRSSA